MFDYRRGPASALAAVGTFTLGFIGVSALAPGCLLPKRPDSPPGERAAPSEGEPQSSPPQFARAAWHPQYGVGDSITKAEIKERLLLTFRHALEEFSLTREQVVQLEKANIHFVVSADPELDRMHHLDQIGAVSKNVIPKTYGLIVRADWGESSTLFVYVNESSARSEQDIKDVFRDLQSRCIWAE